MTARDAPYLLSHLHNNAEEDSRLDKQHVLIKSLVHEGKLLHRHILEFGLPKAIADVACGTGIFLNDISRDLFSKAETAPIPRLVGFDINSARFVKVLEPGVELHEHDCTKPFPEGYRGKFDVVNIRLIWPAIRQDALSQFLSNALSLLKPGGYLQWFESEFSTLKLSPSSPEFEAVLKRVSMERQARGLMMHAPSVMLQVLLDLRSTDKADITFFEILNIDNPEALANLGEAAQLGMVNLVFFSLKILLEGARQRLENGRNLLLQDVGEMRRLEDFLIEAMEVPKKWTIGMSCPSLLVQKAA